MKLIILLFSLAWRNLWRNPRRTLIILAAATVGMWSMVVFSSLLRAWADSFLHDAVITLTGHGQIHAPGYLNDPGVVHSMAPPSNALEKLLNSSEVTAWAARVRVPAVLLTEYENAPVTMVGINPNKERNLSFVATAVHSGRYLNSIDDPGILLGRKLAKRLQTGLGKRVVIMSQSVTQGIAERGFRVIGIYDAAQQETETQFVFIARDQAQRMLGLGDDISSISFILHDIDNLPEFLSRLRNAAPDLDIQSWAQLQPFTLAMFQLGNGFIELWTVVMFIVMAFGIVNTLLMAVFERTRELGLLQALGMRPRLILIQVLLESLLLIGLGVLFGLAFGTVSILVFHNGLDLGSLAQGADWFGASKTLHPHLQPADMLTIGGFVWIMGIIVSLYPAWRAANRIPIDAINKG